MRRRWLRRSSVRWHIGGTIHAGPSPGQLESLVRGRDRAIIIPPDSKVDQDGTVWGAHPIWQVHGDQGAAFEALLLQRLEPASPCHSGARLYTALFTSEPAAPVP